MGLSTQRMASHSLLRGPRKWAAIAGVVVLIFTIHLAGRWSGNHPYIRYVGSGKWDDFSRDRWGKQSPQDSAQQHGLTPAEKAALKQDPTKGPEYVSDVHQNHNGVQPSLSRPEPMSTGPAAPHNYKHADDFMQIIHTIRDYKNLTLAEAMAPCDWNATEFTQFPWGARGAEYVINHRPQWEIDLIRERVYQYLETSLTPYPAAANFSGRGIVIVGGHPKSLKRVHVLINALRDVGSKLPVELHYWGKEMTEQTKNGLLKDFPSQFYLNDLSSPDSIFHSNRTYNEAVHLNFQLKTAALLNSRFAEPLLMDSDNIPAQDPELLWESDTYKEYGTIFWPDIQRTQPENPVYAITNTLCRKDEYELESGQLLVNKQLFFYHLQLADWFMGQIYFQPYLLGDKDTFRFAWRTLKTEYGSPRRWVTSVGVVLDREDPEDPAGFHQEHCGHSFAQHHPDTGDVAFVHGGTLKSFSYPLLNRLRAQGGLFQSYKRSSVDSDWSQIEYGVHLKYMSASYLYEHWPSPDPTEELLPEDSNSNVLCTEMQKVERRDAKEILPKFEGTFERSGGYWPVDDEYRSGSSGA